MEFNPGKCQILHITRARTPMKTLYTMHNQSLNLSPLLGTSSDSLASLKFNTHINRITSSFLNSLNKISDVNTPVSAKRHTRQLSGLNLNMALPYGVLAPNLIVTKLTIYQKRWSADLNFQTFIGRSTS